MVRVLRLRNRVAVAVTLLLLLLKRTAAVPISTKEAYCVGVCLSVVHGTKFKIQHVVAPHFRALAPAIKIFAVKNQEARLLGERNRNPSYKTNDIGRFPSSKSPRFFFARLFSV